MRTAKSFSLKQVNGISNILDNAGSVLLGATVLTPIVTDFDRVSWLVVILGIAVTLACWMSSIWILRVK